MKKLIALLLVLVLAVSMVACAGPATGSKGTIAVIAKGETHAFWQAVKAGAVDAGKAAGYDVTFQGPTSESESEVPNQRNMVQAALANKNVKAIVLATIGLGFSDELISAFDKGLPVVEFDSGLYNNNADVTAGKDPVIGSVATDNRKAGGVVAENFYAYLKAQNVLVNGYKVGVIQHDATSTGIDRAEGFIEKINELAAADSITLEINRQEKQNNAGEYKLGLTALTEWGAQAIFMTNEGVVNEVYPEVKDNAAPTRISCSAALTLAPTSTTGSRTPVLTALCWLAPLLRTPTPSALRLLSWPSPSWKARKSRTSVSAASGTTRTTSTI